ncbi:MAG: type III secretion system stator protein SctL [Puniceicoccales bacterium]|jgi:type III secretion protein L|nr:type III secretion system stator protein SctL [Puniceicoccales bacterium]
MWIVDSAKKNNVATAKRVLRADEFLSIRGTAALISEAEKISLGIIDQAKKQAQEIIANAQGEAKKIKDSTQEAFEAERKKGFECGAVEGKKAMAVKLMEITAKNVRSFANLEEVILNIVMRSLRRIIGELDGDEVVRRVVGNALKVIGNQKTAIVRVAPDQAAAARDGIAKMGGGDGQLPLVEVVADGRLEKDSCIVETEIGVVDASLEVQLSAIRGVLEKTFSSL